MKDASQNGRHLHIAKDGKAVAFGRVDPKTGRTSVLVAGRTRQPMHPLLRFARAVSVIAGVAYAITRRR